jgi:CheY-like chemotaxis protein
MTADPGAAADPRVVICAWCGKYGRVQAAVRGPDQKEWEPVSHAFAQVAKKAGLASHGVCRECKEREKEVIDRSFGPASDEVPLARALRSHILVVEDEPHLNEVLVAALRDEGYDVEGVRDGGAALASVRRQQPAVILLDLMMPGYSGWDFLDDYRRTPLPHAPVLVITAAAASTLLGVERQVQAVITKPYSLDHVLSLIHSYTHLTADHNHSGHTEASL